MYLVYILRCADGSLYTGITTNLSRRLSEHNSDNSNSKYTRSRRPVSLVYSFKLRSRSEALKEEVRIKALSKRQKELLILGIKNI